MTGHTRRRFLKLAGAAGGIGLAGCVGGTEQESTPTAEPTPAATPTQTPRDTPTPTAAATDTREPTETPRDNPDTIFVAPAGSDTAAGTRENPIGTIQEGFNRAQPGETIHALPGRYHERVETVRPGTAENPIVLTGPPEAVFLGGDETPLPGPLKIFHSHVHILGLTFDGLQNPDKPDVVSKNAPGGSSYAQGNIQVNPFSSGSEDVFPGYIRDVKVKPHAVGNVLGAMINTFFTHDVEIGEFRVIGPGGLKHLKGSREGHNGEVVYVGTPAVQYPVVYPDNGEARIPDGYGPDAQQVVCGNEVDGETHGQPTKACPGSVPTADTVGHRGGDSPYA